MPANCTTWECYNSFSGWVAAFGTILISAIALWLSVRDRRVNLKASFDSIYTTGASPLVLDRRGFMLSFTNVGPRPVTVTGHTWRLPFQRRQLFFTPHLEPGTAHLNSKLPTEITDGKTGRVFYKRDFFSELEQPEVALFHPNKAIAFMRIHLFCISLGTSVGKRVKVKISRNSRRELWQLYKGHSNSLKSTPLRGAA